MIPGTSNNGRVAAYGPAMFGAGASAGAAAPISETAFGGAMEAGLSGGGDGMGAGRAWNVGASDEGEAAVADKPKFQAFLAAFQAQLIHQQTASFKPTKAVAMATMVAETYHKIMIATRPDGLAQAMPSGQTVIDGPRVNFLA